VKARESHRFLLLAAVGLGLAGAAFPQAGFVLTLAPAPPPGPPVPLVEGVQGQVYSGSTVSTNGLGPTAWSIIGGALPPGLGLAPNNTFVNIGGTPTAIGTFVFTVQAVDSTANQSATQQYSITIIAPLTITSPSVLRSATVGYNYSQGFSAINGTPPYFWVPGIPAGSIGASPFFHKEIVRRQQAQVPPAGLILSGLGVLSGIPTQAGTYVFDVTVSDSSAVFAQRTSGTFTLTVNVAPSITTPSALPGGTVGAIYSIPIRAQGGTIPYQWAATSGVVPPGLTLAADGGLTGTPTTPGAYSFTATVTDSWGAPASVQFSITIAPAFAITTPPLPSGSVGTAYSVQLTAVGGPAPLTWSVSAGTLPAGLTLNPSSGIISGTPTAAGNSQFTIQVVDPLKDIASLAFSITVTPQLAITTTALPNGEVSTAYSQAITATGGTPPYGFAIVGNLPPGLSLNPATGAITGTPTTVGSITFKVQATDAAKNTAIITLSLNIAAALGFKTTSPLPNATVGVAYNQTINVTGGNPPYTFALVSGALPSGLALNSGPITGTPSTAGTSQFTVQVNDATNGTQTQAYGLTVNPPALPAPTPTIGGVNDTEPPAQQPTLSVTLAQAYPQPLTGTMTLTFTSAVGNVDDPMIQFSNGQRTISFTIAAGALTAVFSNPQLASTGTVAGTITLTLSFQSNGQDVTPQPVPTRVIQLPAQAPVISKATATATATGIEVDVTGLSNTRDMASASFQFQAAAGTTLQGSLATITVDQLFAGWFNSKPSLPFGGQFTYTQPFTITGNMSGVTGLTVTLTNKQGASNTVNVTVP